MNKILTISDYGAIKIRLKEFMDERHITRGALSSATGINYVVVDRWYKGKVERMDLDVLARICCVLECDISDLLVYKPKQSEP